MNDASSESSDGSASSDGSSSEGEDEVQEPLPEVEVKVEPENNVKWNLSEFLPGGVQKSPNEAPLSHEPVETVKMEEQDDEEDGEIQRTPSDHYQNENSNSSIPDNKSDGSQEADELSMPPPAKVKSPSKTPDKTPDADLNTVLVFIKNLQKIQPISSISDSDDNVDNVTSGNERPKKKRPKKRLRPEVDGGNNSSSDESSRFSESRRRSSMDEKKPIRGRPKNNSLSIQQQPTPTAMPPYDVTNTSSDTNSTNGTKKTHKSPRKEPKSRKATTNRRRQSISHKKSRETIPSTDGSSDENQNQVKIQKPPKPLPVKSKEPSNHQQSKPVKKPSKKKQKPPEKIDSPIASSSDSEQEQRHKHSHYQSPVPPMSSSSTEHSDSDGSCRSGRGAKNKKIEKNVSDKNKNDTLRRLFNMTKVSEGGKGGKGGAKGKGQVVVITPDDAQNQSKSNDSNASSNGAISVQNPKYLSPSSAFNITTPLSLIVRIDLSRIDLSRLQIPAEKLKNTVIRTKSPAVPIEQSQSQQQQSQQQQQQQLQSKPKKRRYISRHDEPDRWRHHSANNNNNNSSSKNFDQLSVSSSSSSSSAASSEHHQMENPAARMAAYTTNYTNDQLNNNVDHKTKDMNSFYHSPSSVDTKLPKIKRETNAYMKQFTVSSSNLSKDLKMPSNDFRNKIKQEVKEEFDGAQEMRKRASSMTNNSHTYKDKKRKRPDGASDNSLPLPPTNHERLPKSGLVNGDSSMPSSQEIVKKVYVSYFERTSDEIEKAEAR